MSTTPLRVVAPAAALRISQPKRPPPGKEDQEPAEPAHGLGSNGSSGIPSLHRCHLRFTGGGRKKWRCSRPDTSFCPGPLVMPPSPTAREPSSTDADGCRSSCVNSPRSSFAAGPVPRTTVGRGAWALKTCCAGVPNSFEFDAAHAAESSMKQGLALKDFPFSEHTRI